MSNILSLVLFFLLVVMALRTIASGGVYLKIPFLSKVQYEWVDGNQQFLLLTLVSSMIMTGFNLQGLDLSSIRLLIWILIGILILFRTSDTINIYSKAPVVLYVLYLFYLLFRIIDSPDIFIGIRVFLKYLYPFVVLLIFSRLVRSFGFFLIAMKYMLVSALVFSFTSGGATARVFDDIYIDVFGGMLWQGAPFAGYAAIIIAISFGAWWLSHKNRYLLMVLWLLVSSFLLTIRIGVLAGMGSLSMMSIFRYKLRALPIIIGLSGILIAVIMFEPNFRRKMFTESSTYSQQISLDDITKINREEINSAGRFAMWEWSLNLYYKGHELTGSGLGTLQEVFYSLKHPWGNIKIIHNDYVQMLCDTGLIGLILYLAGVLSGILICIRQFTKTNAHLILKICVAITVSAFIAVLTTMYTDNVVNYTFPVHSIPFAFLGMTIGLSSIPSADDERTNQPQKSVSE